MRIRVGRSRNRRMTTFKAASFSVFSFIFENLKVMNRRQSVRRKQTRKRAAKKRDLNLRPSIVSVSSGPPLLLACLLKLSSLRF